MKYTTYYEVTQLIDFSKYQKMKELMDKSIQKKKGSMYYIRKITFESDVLRTQSKEDYDQDQDQMPVFSICNSNEDQYELYLQKKTKQNDLIYKSYAPLTKEECSKILDGDVKWMKNHSFQLFTEFYLQYTLNGLRKGYITDFHKDIYLFKGKGYLIFNTGICRAIGWNADFFSKDMPMIDCINCDSVMTQYKKKASIPQVISNVLHVGNESQLDHFDEVVYVL